MTNWFANQPKLFAHLVPQGMAAHLPHLPLVTIASVHLFVLLWFIYKTFPWAIAVCLSLPFSPQHIIAANLVSGNWHREWPPDNDNNSNNSRNNNNCDCECNKSALKVTRIGQSYHLQLDWHWQTATPASLSSSASPSLPSTHFNFVWW